MTSTTTTPATDWTQLETLLRASDYRGLIDVVRDLTAAERKALMAPAKEFERRTRDVMSAERLWQLRSGLSVIGAAVLPGASALAPWLVRTGFWSYPRNFDLVAGTVEVLRARQVPWLPDLARRLAERLSTRRVDEQQSRLVTELVTLTGIDPPPADGLVLAFATRHRWEAADDRWVALVPRMFEVIGVGRVINASAYHGGGWPAAIAGFAAEGRLDRLELIDAAIGALQRGGRLGDVRGYLEVYTALAPQLPEIVDRVRDYVPLLADAHSSVAGVAQQELFRADDAGSLEVDVLLDASRAVFHRSEKKLIRAQLARMKEVLAREPGRADDVLLAVGALLEHEAADIQASALNLVIAHVAEMSGETKDELATAASSLPMDLRAKAAEVLGVADSRQAGVTLLPSAPVEHEFPPPIDSLAELADEIEAFHSDHNASTDAVRVERILAGVVAFAHKDRDALRKALDRFFKVRSYLVRGHRDWSSLNEWERLSEYGEIASLLGAAVEPCHGTATSPYPPAHAVVGEAQWRRRAEQDGAPAPQRVLIHRLHEISVGLAYAPRPMLVATPTHRSGLLDPEALFDRLAKAAAAGWEPWEHDLALALLRLPDQRDAALAARAEALGTESGKRLAHWLTHDCSIADAGQLGQLLIAPAATKYWYGYEYFLICWPALLPTHSEVISEHLLPYLHDKTLSGRGGGRTLTALSNMAGPMGEHTARAFAHGLDAHDKNDRAEAVDALLTLAARGQWDGSALGQQIGQLAAEVELSLGRVVPCLRDLAQSGAAGQVWDTLAAALPLLLSAELERPPQRLADLLALGVELVEQVRPAARIPELTAVAGRRGSSRIIVEAKRLESVLTS